MHSEQLARLGLKRLPPLIAEPEDSYSEDYRRNCLAWHLLTSKTRAEVGEWLEKQPVRTRQDMRVRMNQLRDQVRELRMETAQP